MQGRYEIVRVLDDHYLVDPESYQRVYRNEDGPALRPGVYLVFWDDGAEWLSYDHHARYMGPFLTRQRAHKALHLLEYLATHSKTASGQADAEIEGRRSD